MNEEDRVRYGVITAFNRRNWWGRIALASGDRVTFHGTCVAGMQAHSPPRNGERVRVLYSDAKRERLLTVFVQR